MLGRLRMTVPQCIDAYTSFSRKIFKRNSVVSTVFKQGMTGFAYSASTFESALRTIVEEYSEAGDTMIPKSTEHYCKV